MPTLPGGASGKQTTKLILFGTATVLLYFGLYIFEDEFLALSKQGDWAFFVPIVTAFVFSFAHGNFTSHFWDVLGIKAKK